MSSPRFPGPASHASTARRRRAPLLVAGIVAVAVLGLATFGLFAAPPGSPAPAVAEGRGTPSPSGAGPVSPGSRVSLAPTAVGRATPTGAAIPAATRARMDSPSAGAQTASASPPGTGAAAGDASLAGTWSVAAGSSVASTVQAGVGPFMNEVTARTNGVMGSTTIELRGGGLEMGGTSFTVDMTRLSTGDGLLDDRLRSILEPDRFPTSTFDQRGTVAMPTVAELRAGATVSISGDLTLHGVRHELAVAAHLRLRGDSVEVTATIPYRLADFDLHGQGLVSLGDTGAIDFHVLMTR